MKDDSYNPSPTDFEIGEIEDYSGNQDNQFSHPNLVMMAMRKVLDNGIKELRPGWFNTKTDRLGNQLQVYIEDTRKAFIESVRTTQMIMACDLDKEAKKKITKYKKRLKKKRKELIALNDEAWTNLSVIEKTENAKNGIRHIVGKLTHPTLIEEYIQYELEIYRRIFAELSRLTKRLDFFNAEIFVA
jgi:hypothetical protein